MVSSMAEDIGSVLPSDKLSYKLVLQNHVSKCLDAMSDIDDLFREVEALKLAMFFNTVNLNFKDEVEAVEDRVNTVYNGKVDAYRAQFKTVGYNPLSATPFYRAWFHERNKSLYIELISILARHDMLTEARGSVDSWRESDVGK